jgi:hypothetical protein
MKWISDRRSIDAKMTRKFSLARRTNVAKRICLLLSNGAEMLKLAVAPHAHGLKNTDHL